MVPQVHQGHLLSQLKNIFPSEQIYEEVRKPTKLRNKDTGSLLELDAWIPNLKIAFEFQDEYHYKATWYTFHPLFIYQRNDSIKRLTTQKTRITLVTVPCWWAGDADSLAATILHQRPDTSLISKHEPIPLNPPFGYFKVNEIPEVGELMLASFPSTPDFHHTVLPKTWWLGEKYDGVRYCWVSSRRKIYSRSGNALQLPVEIQKRLPIGIIEGELWFGRGQYFVTYRLWLRDESESLPWDNARLIGFDAPAIRFQNMSFEKRYSVLLECVSIDHPIMIVTPRVMCKNSVHMNAIVGEIIEDGGEGGILRRVGSLYEPGRTTTLLKLKSSFMDKEGLVVGVENGHVKLKLPYGQICTVPPESVLIPSVAKGDIVSFSYEITSRWDVPINPEIHRLRPDLSWEDVVLNAVYERKHNRFMQAKQWNKTAEAPTGNKAAQASWTDIRSRRRFFEKFAKSRGLDPLVPETWYTTTGYKYEKEFHSIIGHHNNSGTQTLLDLFPEIGLSKAKLLNRPLHYAASRRQALMKYAMDNKFDPLNPDGWYTHPREKILNDEVIPIVLSFHGNLLSRALIDLFPDVPFDHLKLQALPDAAESRRKVFENYAKQNGFDPLDPEKWYSQPRDKLKTIKGLQGVLTYHERSISKALVDLFPDIGLERSKFQFRQRVFHKAKYRRKLFVDYAKENNFEALQPANWYSQPIAKIMSIKGIQSVLSHHSHSITRALLDLFPEIGLDPSQFRLQQISSIEHRRKFFEKYAAAKGFDPLIPNNWYSQPRDKIVKFENGLTILAFYKFDVAKALVELFPDIGLRASKFGG
eukprot:Phypoly_transcript_02703.p1 GENE.Phypoly_transcript_02703~~Phypoly_transcript_02703.p1  ORF type:complete len:811 (+),score=66.41 Phypoly_transcript_02703:184-2616(+)